MQQYYRKYSTHTVYELFILMYDLTVSLKMMANYSTTIRCDLITHIHLAIYEIDILALFQGLIPVLGGLGLLPGLLNISQNESSIHPDSFFLYNNQYHDDNSKNLSSFLVILFGKARIPHSLTQIVVRARSKMKLRRLQNSKEEQLYYLLLLLLQLPYSQERLQRDHHADHLQAKVGAEQYGLLLALAHCLEAGLYYQQVIRYFIQGPKTSDSLEWY